MGFDLSYVLRIYPIKNQNPSQQTTNTLQIQTRQRLQLRALTYDNGVASPTLLEDVASPVLTTGHFPLPPRAIAAPALRRLYVRNALASLQIHGSVSKRVEPEIENCVAVVAETFGVGGFGVVAEIEVTKADVVDQAKAAASLLGLRSIQKAC